MINQEIAIAIVQINQSHFFVTSKIIPRVSIFSRSSTVYVSWWGTRSRSELCNRCKHCKVWFYETRLDQQSSEWICWMSQYSRLFWTDDKSICGYCTEKRNSGWESPKKRRSILGKTLSVGGAKTVVVLKSAVPVQASLDLPGQNSQSLQCLYQFHLSMY